MAKSSRFHMHLLTTAFVFTLHKKIRLLFPDFIRDVEKCDVVRVIA